MDLILAGKDILVDVRDVPLIGEKGWEGDATGHGNSEDRWCFNEAVEVSHRGVTVWVDDDYFFLGKALSLEFPCVHVFYLEVLNH